MSTTVLIEKYDVLLKTLESYKKVAVAFSAGVDSTFLLEACVKALGKGNVVAITAKSCLMPKAECDEAKKYCKKRGIRWVSFDPKILQVEGLSENPKNRCYICKKHIFSVMKKAVVFEGFKYLLDGSNFDDDGDFRPGMKALEELKIKSPLRDLAFTKEEIRSLSRTLEIPTWEKPSYACLATRIPYGEVIDEAKLSLVEKAEDYLRGLGFKEVRVRVHNTVIARIELNPNDFSTFMRGDIRLEVNSVLKGMGFAYVSLDLQGYRTGSMNEVLPESL